MTEPTLDDLKWAIVKAETECPACHGYGALSSFDLVGIHGKDPMYGCTTCSPRAGEPELATGRVPRFPELRAECPIYYSDNIIDSTGLPVPYNSKHHAPMCVCHGLGYVPLWSRPEDAFLWIQVLSLVVGRPFHQAIIGDDWCSALRVATEALGMEVGQEETP